MTIESDFYATDAGRAHFQDQLTSIRYCVQETCNFDTLFAYLTCGNYDVSLSHKHRHVTRLHAQLKAHTFRSLARSSATTSPRGCAPAAPFARP